MHLYQLANRIEYPYCNVSMYRFTGFNWVELLQGGGRWELRVKGNLAPRADNGRINSSPIAAIPPLVRLRHGTTHTIVIPSMYEHTQYWHVALSYLPQQLLLGVHGYYGNMIPLLHLLSYVYHHFAMQGAMHTHILCLYIICKWASGNSGRTQKRL